MGEKGQISTAEKILTDLNVDLSTIDLIGLAKGRSEKKKELEQIYRGL